ncbi:MAG: MBL fold metallo-hydrolase [Clostridiales bacterium]|nr:MBL fold metallo-hydrolase [Clostridiales bacterium]
MIIECIETGEFCTDTYLIVEGQSAVVVDPGADYERILSRLSELKAKAEYVLVTHAHFDHIGAVAKFSECGTKVYISQVDYEMLIKSDFYVDLGFFGESVERFEADIKVKDGDSFTICNHNFTVIETPGHTPGGVCYVMDGKHIFTGDTLFYMSVGRTDFPFCSHSDLMKSIKKLFALQGDYNIYPGHGKSTTLCFERKNNPYVS